MIKIAQSSNDQVSSTPDQVLDVRGHDCPIPAVRAGDQLKRLQPGQLLEVLATDQLAELDLQILCDRLGHELVETVHRGGELIIRIRVSESRRAGAG